MNTLNKKVLKDWILSVQHLLSAFGATVLVPILVGINPAIAVLSAGIGTLLFHLCTRGKVPVFIGSSFAYIAPLITVSQMFGYQYAQGAIVVVGIVYCIMSFIIYKIGSEKIMKLLPSHVVGAMIIVIGLSLVPSAVANIQTHMVVALVTLGISLLITFCTKGFIKQLGILIGVVCGYVLALNFGLVDVAAIQAAPLFNIPKLEVPLFNIESLLIVVPVALCTMCEHIGDIVTNGAVAGKDFAKEPGLHRTMLGDGIATLVAGLLGSVPNTTYSENTSLLAITKNYDPKLLRRTAWIAIVLSFIGMFGAVLQSIPAAVIGGISLQLYCMISFIGVKNIWNSKAYKNIKNLIVMALIIVIGLSGVSVPITATVSLSGLSLAAIVGVVANLILNIRFKK